MCLIKELVLNLTEKNKNTTLVFLLSNCPHVLKIYFMTQYIFLTTLLYDN